MERIIHAEDLQDSGPVIMILFSLVYPGGLTIAQMEDSGVGWLVRAAERIKETT